MRHLPSPCFNDRPDEAVSILVLHYTGMRSLEDALDKLSKEAGRVSCHYLVSETGEIYAMVPEDKRAWHAGVSHWRGRDNLNDVSIGIEIQNPGHEWGYRPFPAAQMDAVAALCQDILSRHAIPPRNVVAHSDIAPLRKEDPGELFDWKWLAEQGVGLWPEVGGQGAGNEKQWDVSAIQKKLGAYGYYLPVTGAMDELTEKTIIAFQRHFRPAKLDGIWDAECDEKLQRLLTAA
ncbi:MAG: N-acetylmuramoyl-L-alanine amidase [Rickettsiales bacterium]